MIKIQTLHVIHTVDSSLLDGEVWGVNVYYRDTGRNLRVYTTNVYGNSTKAVLVINMAGSELMTMLLLQGCVETMCTSNLSFSLQHKLKKLGYKID